MFKFLHKAKKQLLNCWQGIVIDITNNCNLRCVHCYHSENIKENEEKDIDFSEWANRLQYFRSEGHRSIFFLGGEPALRQDVLFEANKTFPFVGLITNGTIIIEKQFNHLLVVSLDGSEELNDSLRGKGVFNRILNNYSGDSRVILNMVITKRNIKEIPKILQIARFMKVKGVAFNIYTPNTGEKNDFIPNKEDREIIKNLLYSELKINKKLLLFTKKMIDSLINGDHIKWCAWRNLCLHYDVHLNRRKCFSNKADCSRCGCYVASIDNPLSTFILNKKIREFILS